MILSSDRWQQVSRFFTDEERAEIFAHKTASTRATFVIDGEQISPRLKSKLKFHFDDKTPADAFRSREKGAAQ